MIAPIPASKKLSTHDLLRQNYWNGRAPGSPPVSFFLYDGQNKFECGVLCTQGVLEDALGLCLTAHHPHLCNVPHATVTHTLVAAQMTCNECSDAFVGRFLGGLVRPFLLSQDAPVSSVKYIPWLLRWLFKRIRLLFY